MDSTDATPPGGPAGPVGGPPLLDPADISLERGPRGELRLSEPGMTHLRVSCYRAFPLTAPEEWIVFFEGDGAHIGVLASVDALDPASAAACREELDLRYLVPWVDEVLAVREESGENRWRPAQIWDVRTDRGVFRLRLPNLTDHVRLLDDGSMLLSDRDGRRCRLDADRLDDASLALLRHYLWAGPVERRGRVREAPGRGR